MKEIPLIVFLFSLLLGTALAEKPVTGQHTAKNTSTHHLLPYAVDRASEGFAKTANGGIMQIVAKSADDAEQIKLMQQYLQQTAMEYGKGDFSSTERFHGTDIPGLAQMKADKANKIKYEYKALTDGGQIVFSTEDLQLLEALHAWLDFQINAHGNTPLLGHQQNQPVN